VEKLVPIVAFGATEVSSAISTTATILVAARRQRNGKGKRSGHPPTSPRTRWRRYLRWQWFCFSSVSSEADLDVGKL